MAPNKGKPLGIEVGDNTNYFSFSGIGNYDGQECLFKVSTLHPAVPTSQLVAGHPSA